MVPLVAYQAHLPPSGGRMAPIPIRRTDALERLLKRAQVLLSDIGLRFPPGASPHVGHAAFASREAEMEDAANCLCISHGRELAAPAHWLRRQALRGAVRTLVQLGMQRQGVGDAPAASFRYERHGSGQ